MGKLNTDTFMDSASSNFGGSFSKWKEKGSTIGWIHPKLGIYERLIHGMVPVQQETDDGDVKMKNRRFICAGDHCPMDELGRFAEKCINQGEVDEDDLVLRGGKIRLTFSDLAGKSGWKSESYPIPQKEYVFAWIPRDDRDDDSPVEIITATVGLGSALVRAIRSVKEDRGEKKGDPLKNPYAFKLVYSVNESPAKKYDVRTVDSDIAEIDDEVTEIMRSSGEDLGIDLDGLCEPISNKEMMGLLETCWVNKEVPFEEFEEFFGNEDDEDVKSKRKKNKKEKSKKKSRDDENDEDEDEDEDEKPKRKKNGRKKKNIKKKIKCECCDEKVIPDEDGKCPVCEDEMDVP